MICRRLSSGSLLFLKERCDMKKIVLLILSIYVIIPITLICNPLGINNLFLHQSKVTGYFKIVLPMLLPTAALLLTLSRYREEDNRKVEENTKKENSKNLKEKEASRPYFSVKYTDKKLQVFTSNSSPVLNVSLIYSYDRKTIIEKGGMISSELIELSDKEFERLLLHAKTVRGEEVYFVYTADTKTGSHYILINEKFTAYSNGGDYELCIVDNYRDFIIVRKEYQKNYMLGKFHKFIVEKDYNNALLRVIKSLREEEWVSQTEKLYLLVFLYSIFENGQYEVENGFDRKYASSNSSDFNGIDWRGKFINDEDIDNKFLAYYILDILDAYKMQKIESLDFLLRPIEVFVRDSITIYTKFQIEQMEQLLLGEQITYNYAKGMLSYLPLEVLEKMKTNV